VISLQGEIKAYWRLELFCFHLIPLLPFVSFSFSLSNYQSIGSKYVKCYNIIRLVQHNDYPMREWHLENMKKTIVKYVGGLSEDDAKSKYKMKLHRKYKGNLAYVRKSIDIDIRHGVTREEVTEYLDKILNDPSFSDIRKSEGSKERIAELQLK
jgi:hypothetical protein